MQSKAQSHNSSFGIAWNSVLAIMLVLLVLIVVILFIVFTAQPAQGQTLSSGGNVPHADIPVEPGYQTLIAEKIRCEEPVPCTVLGVNPQNRRECEHAQNS